MCVSQFPKQPEARPHRFHGLDVGRDALSPVVDDYEPPFPFTGTIDRITFAIRSRADAEEIAAKARPELAKE